MILIKVFNDIHADPKLINRILCSEITQGDLLVANGDFLGSSSPLINDIVKAFYGVKHGKITKDTLQKVLSKILHSPVFVEDELIFESIHSGTFLAKMYREYSGLARIIDDEVYYNFIELDRINEIVKEKGGELIYLPGNGEIMISDFDITDGVNYEKTLPPKERLYDYLVKKEIFEKFNIEYITRPRLVRNETLLIPIDYLDEKNEERETLLNLNNVHNLIVHYPPFSLSIIDCFNGLFGYSPNEMDVKRMKIVSDIVEELPNLNTVVFGHIHPEISEESIEKLPKVIFFKEKDCYLVWNCPGHVYALT